MVAARCCPLLLLLLCTCMALLPPPPGAQGAPLEPVYPGDDATPEQMAQYAAEMRRHINMLTRLRYGKSAEQDPLAFATAPGGFHRLLLAQLPTAKRETRAPVSATRSRVRG
ncbi:pancreatic prohormone [Octodon degus]|uniref:Pancreatic prohormone n=1 Tax=Octodon degus TaxID=10160 RepID=A0A6P3EXI7_OCTDE|nr:pancreatic prohormone [Octodon degus]